jgi:hypothetical protein
MRSYIEAWDDQDIEPPDWPTEQEVVQETYPDITPQDYRSRDELDAALWERYAHDLYTDYDRAGRDVYPDPYGATIDAVKHAADILWAIHQQEEQQ